MLINSAIFNGIGIVISIGAIVFLIADRCSHSDRARRAASLQRKTEVDRAAAARNTAEWEAYKANTGWVGD